MPTIKINLPDRLFDRLRKSRYCDESTTIAESVRSVLKKVLDTEQPRQSKRSTESGGSKCLR